MGRAAASVYNLHQGRRHPEVFCLTVPVNAVPTLLIADDHPLFRSAPRTAAADAEDQAEHDLAARIASLAPQQFRVLMMLADGRLNKQIAGELDVTEATIRAHVTAILRKLGLYRRTQAAVLAQRLLRAQSGCIAPGDVAGEDESDAT
jgi:DNA-binding NarL/FixJ family response regulator